MSSVDLGLSRISQLLDANSFVELGAEVRARSTDFSLQDVCSPSDGVITGYGTIGEQLVFVYSQNPEVLGGTIGEMHAKKIAALYKKAVRMGAPVIGLIDCGGIRLQEASDAIEGLGRMMAAASSASGVVPQIAVVCGTCGGGMATFASMADVVLMQEGGSLFFNSPNAIAGNRKEKCDTSCADFAAAEGGVVDFVGTADEVAAKIRTLLNILPLNCDEGPVVNEPVDDMNRGVSLEGLTAADAMAQLADAGSLIELKKAYAEDMACGLMTVGGITIGAFGNNAPELSAEGCEKAADFVKFCDAFSIPVLSITNATGYKASVESEKRLGRAISALTVAVASADVPKINLINGQAGGTAYLTMNSRALGADLVYATAGSKVAPMDGASAAKIMYADATAAEQGAKAADFDALQGSLAAFAGRGYVDRIINDADARKYIISGFDMLLSKSEDPLTKKHASR